MGFLRRKSVAAADGEEARPRNRLSKPMTSKSSFSSGSGSGVQSPQSKSRNVSVSQITLSESAPTMSKKESGIHLKTQIFETVEEVKPTSPVKDIPKRTDVASLVKKFENTTSTSQLSLVSSIPPPKPLSTLYSTNSLSPTKPHYITTFQSKDQLRPEKGSVSTLVSRATSAECLADPFVVPKRRESKYRPGEATRKSSAEDKENQAPKEQQPETIVETVSLQQEASEGDLQEQWTPPPPVARTETPTSLDVKAIGGLRLGSLHVVNSQTAPLAGELSKQLISRELRPVSSEYADSVYSKDFGSEAWEDANVADDVDEAEVDEPRTPTGATFEAGTRQVLTPASEPKTPNRGTPSSFASSAKSPDKTSTMAQAYRDELQASPFSCGVVSPSSTGSVMRYEKKLDVTDPVDEDGERAEADRRISLGSDQPSIESKPSVSETIKTRDLVFSSALEYQAPIFQPPASPERGISPDTTTVRSDTLGRPYDKLDSGYNSGASAVSINMKENKIGNKQTSRLQLCDTLAPDEPVADVEGSKSKKENSPRKFGRFFPIRPATRKAPASAPVMPTLKTSQPDLTATSNVATSPVKIEQPVGNMKKEKTEKAPKASKSPKKLHKVRPLSRVRESKEIVVQRLASCESTLDIPAISETTKANLQHRSSQIPELEQTYKSQDHIRHQPSICDFTAQATNIRFPSPQPDSDGEDERLSRDKKKDRGRSVSRNRSKSRRKSWLSIFKSDKDSDKRPESGSKKESRLSITDFGDVVTSLGSNPYDIAHPRPQTSDTSLDRGASPRTNPHDISTNRPQHRLSMSDEQASEFARMRSHSFSGNDRKGERKPVLNDRTKFRDRILRRSMTEELVPPMPPLPNKEQLKRISQRYSLQSSAPGTPNQTQQLWEESPHTKSAPESSPAPPPPSHSPTPVVIQDSLQRSYSPQRVPRAGYHLSWDAEAEAWKERRQSACDTLRSHRHSSELRGGGDNQRESVAIEDDEGPIYPVIPRKPVPKRIVRPEQGQHLSENDQYDDLYRDSYMHVLNNWDDCAQDPFISDQRDQDHSLSSYRSRHQRHHTWNEGPGYDYPNDLLYGSHHDAYGNHHSDYEFRASNDSRESFYNHNNCPIDRPFDRPALVEDWDDDYDHRVEYYTPQTSPVRNRKQYQQNTSYAGYNGYEGDYYPEHNNEYYLEYDYQDHDQNQNYNAHPPVRSNSYIKPQYQPSHPPSHSWTQSPDRPYQRSDIPEALIPSRPTSRQSVRSNTPNPQNQEQDLHLDVATQPLEYSQYSGGLEYGYEGRDTGFGGSAGTRSDSGRANAMFKGVELRETHGVDLGDVPVIGIVKRG